MHNDCTGHIFSDFKRLLFKKGKIKFDLKDLESDSVDYAICLNLEDKIEIFKRRDLEFREIIC